MKRSVRRFLPVAATLAATLLYVVDTRATTIAVGAGDDLQAAINAAQPGDTLLLEPGATYKGNFVLPVKSGGAPITIMTAPQPGHPGPGQRISPAHASTLARIRSGNPMAALSTAPGAHGWRIVLVEFAANRDGYGEIIQIGDASSAQNTLATVPYDIEFDRVYIHGDPVMGQKRGIALNGRSITIRNSHISDIKGVGMDTQAICGWNGPGPFVIENNYLEAAGENIMFGGADPSIPDLVSGDIVIRGNHITRPMSWKEPIIPTPSGLVAQAQAGGSLTAGVHTYRVVARMGVSNGVTARSTASEPVSVPVAAGGQVTLSWTPVPHATSYDVYRQSPTGASQYWSVTSPTFVDAGNAGQNGTAPGSSGSVWTVKNLLELKNARNVLIEQNVFENHWAGAQPGWAIVFTPRNQDGKCAWCVVEDVTFRQNLVRNTSGGINILGYDDLAPSRQTKRIRIEQNLFTGITPALGGHGWFLLMGNGPRDITVDHNTIDSAGTTILYVYGPTAGGITPVPGFVFTNNAARHSSYGINGADASFGNDVIAKYFSDGLVTANWIQGGYASRYPAGNYFDGTFDSAFTNIAGGDYTAAAGGPLAGRALDGSNIGADIPALASILRNVLSSAPVSIAPPKNLRILTK